LGALSQSIPAVSETSGFLNALVLGIWCPLAGPRTMYHVRRRRRARASLILRATTESCHQTQKFCPRCDARRMRHRDAHMHRHQDARFTTRVAESSLYSTLGNAVKGHPLQATPPPDLGHPSTKSSAVPSTAFVHVHVCMYARLCFCTCACAKKKKNLCMQAVSTGRQVA
jgi:hypothetical protein